jgi:hypothetical protein
MTKKKARRYEGAYVISSHRNAVAFLIILLSSASLLTSTSDFHLTGASPQKNSAMVTSDGDYLYLQNRLITAKISIGTIEPFSVIQDNTHYEYCVQYNWGWSIEIWNATTSSFQFFTKDYKTATKLATSNYYGYSEAVLSCSWSKDPTIGLNMTFRIYDDLPILYQNLTIVNGKQDLVKDSGLNLPINLVGANAFDTVSLSYNNNYSEIVNLTKINRNESYYMYDGWGIEAKNSTNNQNIMLFIDRPLLDFFSYYLGFNGFLRFSVVSQETYAPSASTVVGDNGVKNGLVYNYLPSSSTSNISISYYAMFTKQITTLRL